MHPRNVIICIQGMNIQWIQASCICWLVFCSPSDLYKENVLILFQNFNILHVNLHWHVRRLQQLGRVAVEPETSETQTSSLDAITKMKPRDFSGGYLYRAKLSTGLGRLKVQGGGAL